MTKEFCKIFYHDEIGQVVVMKDNDDDGDPTITITISVDSNFVNNVTQTNTFRNSKERDHAFENISEDFVFFKAVYIYELAKGIENEND